MKRFALAAGLAAAAFTALCAFLLRDKPAEVTGPPAPAAASSAAGRGFLDRYFRGVYEAESGPVQAH